MKELGRLFADVSRCHASGVHNEVSKLGVGRGMPPMLGYIREHDGCKQSELCKSGRISAATVTVMLQSLEKNGFITRTSDKDDQRCVRIRITPKGEETERMSRETVERYDADFFGCLSEEEQAALRAILVKLAENNDFRCGKNEGKHSNREGENAQ